MYGQIWEINSGFYEIRANNKKYVVRGRGKLRNQNIVPLVGDFVEFSPAGFLEIVYERKNFLVRPKVANIDQAIIVTSLKEPKYSSLLLNKFLAIIEFNKIKPIILFTKKDLTGFSYKTEYINQGYEAYEISNYSKEGIEEVKSIFSDKLTVFTGQTGAGKSSTINSIANLDIKTQEISKALGRGKHTTRIVKIIKYLDGYLIDTPGFSSLEFNLKPIELAHAYHDFKKYSLSCKFRSCIHYKEQYCQVKNKLKAGKISQDRYRDYIKLLKEVL